MLFFVCLALTISGFMAWHKWLEEYDNWKDWLSSVCLAVGVISGTIAVIMALVIVCEHFTAEGTRAGNEMKHESLVYQLENDLYNNDNDLGKKELYNQITDWNIDLAKCKARQRDFWVGIFYSNIYDEFEFIEFPDN